MKRRGWQQELAVLLFYIYIFPIVETHFKSEGLSKTPYKHLFQKYVHITQDPTQLWIFQYYHNFQCITLPLDSGNHHSGTYPRQNLYWKRSECKSVTFLMCESDIHNATVTVTFLQARDNLGTKSHSLCATSCPAVLTHCRQLQTHIFMRKIPKRRHPWIKPVKIHLILIRGLKFIITTAK
jgi:hypothetical protein